MIHGAVLRVATLASVLALAAACTQDGRIDDPGTAPMSGAAPAPTPLVDGTSLEAGTYVLEVEGVQVTFTVPDGWTAWRYGVMPSDGGAEPPGGIGLGFWVVDQVYGHACRWPGTQRDIGPTVDDLVTALIRQRGSDTSDARNVTLGGYEGRQLELHVPPDADIDACSGAEFRRWTALPEGGRYNQGPSQIDRLWILEVDGTRLVVDAAYFPGTPSNALAELFAIVDTVELS